MNIQRSENETDEAFAIRIADAAIAETAAIQAEAIAREQENSELSALLTDAGVAEAPTLVERCRALVTEVANVRRYRDTLIEDTLKQGVRAHGVHFQPEVYRKMLAMAEIESIWRVYEDLKATGDRLRQDYDGR